MPETTTHDNSQPGILDTLCHAVSSVFKFEERTSTTNTSNESNTFFSSVLHTAESVWNFAEACFLPPPAYTKLEFDEVQYPYPVKFLDIPDPDQRSKTVRVAYMDEGQGTETILFVHGLGSYAASWVKNINTLRKQYRCVAIDLPGYGKSSKKHDISMKLYAYIVKQVIERLGLQNVTLCGHSMGGQLSIFCATEFPALVKNLILVAPAGIEEYSTLEKVMIGPLTFIPWVRAWSPMQVYTAISVNFYDMPQDAMFMVRDAIGILNARDVSDNARAMMLSVRTMGLEPVFERLPSIRQRTLIVFGHQDMLIPNRFMHGGSPAQIGALGKKLIPNSTLLMVNRAGHMAHFEQAGMVNAAIEQFLG